MANVLIVSKSEIEAAEKAINNLLGKYWKGNRTMNGSDIDAFEFLGHTAQEDDGSNWPSPGLPSGKYIVNADKLINKLSLLTQDELNAIQGRFQNVNMVNWITANMVDESTVKFYRPTID